MSLGKCKSVRMSCNGRHISIELYLCTLIVISLCSLLEAQQQEPQTGVKVTIHMLNTTVGKLESSGKAAKKSVSGESIDLLIEEILRLKSELVPESAKRIGPPTSRPAPPPPPASSSSLEAPIRKRSSEGVNYKQQQQQQQQQPVAVASTKSLKTVCEQSIAVALLGYRVLCNKSSRPRLTPSGQANITHLTPEMKASLFASLKSVLDLQDADDSVESNELTRLRGLLDKLIRNGNFRPISRASSSDPQLQMSPLFATGQ